MLFFNRSLALDWPITVAVVDGQVSVTLVPAWITELIVVTRLLMLVTKLIETATSAI